MKTNSSYHKCEFVVCYTKEDVYILWQKYMQKKKMKLNLKDCVFQKNSQGCDSHRVCSNKPIPFSKRV